jgi:hypothetical protein
MGMQSTEFKRMQKIYLRDQLSESLRRREWDKLAMQDVIAMSGAAK